MNRAERRKPSPTRAAAEANAKRRTTIIYISLGVLAVVLIVSVGLMSRVPKTASDAPVFAQLTVGQVAPTFAVSTTAGPFDLAQAGGKPTLLEVFATWCPHCQKETTTMSALYRDYRSRVNIVGVEGSERGLDNAPASAADMMTFAQKYKAQYPLAFDPQMNVAKAYLQGGYPTIVLIDKDKKVLAIGGGEIAETSLRTALDNVLAGKPVHPTFGS